MHVLKAILAMVFLVTVVVACKKADPVPASQCGKVVAHVAKVLGDNAPSRSKMMSQCKAASDEARGCAMEADKPMKVLKCDL